MANVYWKKSVSTLIGSIWLYTLAGIAASITGVVNAYLNPSGMMGRIMDLMNGESPMQISMGDIVEKIFTIFVLIGYYLFFRSLTRFMRLQSESIGRRFAMPGLENNICFLVKAIRTSLESLVFPPGYQYH